MATEAFLPILHAVPNFPDNALPSLGSEQARVDMAGLNYVPVGRSPQAIVGAVAAGASGVPAIVDIPTAANAANAAVNPQATDGPASATPTSGSAPVMAGAVVAHDSTATASTMPPDGSGPTTGSDSAPAQDAKGPGTKTARTGTAGIAVSSANGPLDVVVVDGGINVNGVKRKPAR